MMNFDRLFIPKNRMEILLALSLIPLLIKSVGYIFIGSLYPLIVFVLFGGLLIFAYSNETKFRSLIIKTWSLGIILWGVARIGLMILFLFTPVDEVHVRSQFGIWFILLSSIHITAGFYFLRTIKIRLKEQRKL